MISSYELIIDVDNNIYSIVKGIIVSVLSLFYASVFLALHFQQLLPYFSMCDICNYVSVCVQNVAHKC